MKLYYDKRLKDPTYYIQQGFRNGKKTTTKNIKRLGKHSELLLITDNPLEYAKNEVKKMNEEYRSGRSEFIVTMDFNERIPSTDSPCSNSTSLNIGYVRGRSVCMDISWLRSSFEELKACSGASREALLETLSPTRCVGCERPGVLLCDDCLNKLVLIDPEESCTLCGAPYGRALCTECRGAASSLDRCLACALFSGALPRVIRAYKDGGERRLVPRDRGALA